MNIAPEDVQEIRFTVVKGAKPGATVSFEGGLRTIRIGRAVDNEIVVADPTVSRLHARVEIRADGWFLVDAGSSAGVEKMGFRLGTGAEPLESGDEFKLGETILRFEVVAKKGALKRSAEAASDAAASAPPAPSLLARIGLDSLRTQALALLVVLLLAAFAFWPSPPQLPPQSNAVLPADYNAQFGFLPGGDRSHLDAATFDVPADGEGLGIYFEALAVSGVEVRAGGRAVGRIEPSNAWGSYQIVIINRAAAKSGKIRVTFDNLGYEASAGSVDPASQKPWGVRRIWLARVADASSSLAQLADELHAVSTRAERIDDNLGNRNAIVRSLRRASLGLMKFAGRPAILVPIPEPKRISTLALGDLVESARVEIESERPDKALDRVLPALQKADAELGRDYRRVLNGIELAKKKSNPPELARLVATGMRLLPDNTDPRHRIMVAEAKQLKGRTALLYNEALDRLGSGFSS